MGTDALGRDLFVRVTYAGRFSLVIGICVALLSSVVGALYGLVAGYAGGAIDAVLMRFCDLLLSIPSLPLLLVLSKFFGGSPIGIVAVLSAFGWMPIARIVRGNVLSLRSREFVEAALVLGVPTRRILLKHVLPNTLAPVIVFATLSASQAILAEASLSYLGMGVQPPVPTWGNLLMGAQQYLLSAPWLAVSPGCLILLTVLSLNLLGDGLRDALDPRLRGRR
ncbi:MAG: ABC transporter permease [Bacillota bacterium]